MDLYERILYSLDYSLNTQRKRHIIGGFLLSVSLLFGGLSATVMTINVKKAEDYEDEE